MAIRLRSAVFEARPYMTYVSPVSEHNFVILTNEVVKPLLYGFGANQLNKFIGVFYKYWKVIEILTQNIHVVCIAVLKLHDPFLLGNSLCQGCQWMVHIAADHLKAVKIGGIQPGGVKCIFESERMRPDHDAIERMDLFY